MFIGRLGAILKKVVTTGRCPRLIDPQAGAERIILGLKEVSERGLVTRSDPPDARRVWTQVTRTK